MYFHPLYDRDQVVPPDGPAYGHIPPLAWLPAMAEAKGATEEEAAWLQADAEARARSNYQRRNPCMMVNILRADHLNAATGGGSVVELTVADPVTGETEVVEASGLLTYTRNALELGRRSEDELLGDLAEDMNICFG